VKLLIFSAAEFVG